MPEGLRAAGSVMRWLRIIGDETKHIMKTFFVIAVVLSAALVSAEPPAVRDLSEVPAQYRGTFYLHEKQAQPGQTEGIEPAQVFGKIDAQQVLLDGTNRLTVASVKQTIFPGRDGQPVPSIVVRFEQTNLMWGVAEMPDTTLGIMQLAFNAQKNTLGEFVWFGVSRTKAAVPHAAPVDPSVIRLAKDPQPPFLTTAGGMLPVGGAASAATEPPVVTELAEIPTQYCGTYYLYGTGSVEAGMEYFSPTKPFGRIAARLITLCGGQPLKVASIQRTVLPGHDGGAQKTVINIQFEQADFTWGISEMPDSKLAILQTVFNLDSKKMQGTMFVVSQKP